MEIKIVGKIRNLGLVLFIGLTSLMAALGLLLPGQPVAADEEVLSVETFATDFHGVIKDSAPQASLTTARWQEAAIEGQTVTIGPPQSKSGEAGQAISFSHWLTNTSSGVLPQVFTITAQSELWPIVWQPVTTTLIPGQAEMVTLTVSIPLTAPDYSINQLQVAVTSQASPDTPLDTVYNVLTVLPRPQLIPITADGITTDLITITEGTPIVWSNQTGDAQELTTCQEEPDQYLIYFPLIFQNASPDAVVLQADHLSDDPIQATLPPGQTYTRTFTTAGAFIYCLAGFPDQPKSVIVTEGPAPDFLLNVTPTSQTVSQDEAAFFHVHLNAYHGLTESIFLTLPDLPIDLLAEFANSPAAPTAKTGLFITPTVTTLSGSHAITVQANINDLIHTTVVTLNVTPTEPDLVVQAIEISPEVPEVTQTFTISLTIHNQGDAPAGPFAVDWYAAPGGPPANVSGDLRWNVAALADGQTMVISGVYSLTTSGSYTAYAQIDTEQSVSESNEANNLLAFAYTISPPLPDLIVSDMVLDPLQPTPSEPVTVTLLLKNQGSLTVTQPFSVDWYIREEDDPIPDAVPPFGELQWTVSDDLADGYILRPGGERAVTAVFTPNIPGPPFDYYARIDTTDTVTESNENNNFVSFAQKGLDIAIVFDRSGSMEFDPVCYGCWERDGDSVGDYGSAEEFYTYPSNGTFFPIGYDGIPSGDPLDGGFTASEVQRVISHTLANSDPGTSVYQDGGDNYIIMEAELYSQNNSVVDTAFRSNGKGYWALQRGEGHYDSGATPYFASTGTSIDGKGAHMAHHPSTTFYPSDTPYGRHYTLAEANDGAAPGLEYDFEFRSGAGVSWDSNASVWARVHAGRGLAVDNPRYDDPIDNTNAYWAIDQAADWTGLNRPTLQNIPAIPSGTGTGWTWIELTDSLSVVSGNKYRLYFHAGSSGFSIDRIVVTDDNGTLPSEVRDGTIKATTGSAYRDAAEKCNPIYAAQITAADVLNIDTICPFRSPSQPIDNRLHPLFGEWEAPMRPAKESLKELITRIESVGSSLTEIQIGLVSFNGQNSTTITHMRCIRRWGYNDCRDAYGYDELLIALESIEAGNSTNTTAGMRDSLNVLGVPGYTDGTLCDSGGSCARGDGSKKVIILITDGVPNQSSGCPEDRPDWPDNDPEHECPLYYAQEAANAGIMILTMGISYGVNHDYLAEIAHIGNGFYVFDPTGLPIDYIFQELMYLPFEPVPVPAPQAGNSPPSP